MNVIEQGMKAPDDSGGAFTLVTPHYTQSISGVLSGAIGDGGLTLGDLDQWLARSQASITDLRAAYAANSLPILTISDEREDIELAEVAFEKLVEDAKTVVFFGTGGSSLGGQTFAQFGGWNIPGDAVRGQRRRPRTRFYDNLDPRTLSMAIARLDLESTRFVITSKSGGTAETLSQAIVLIKALQGAGLGDRISKTILGVTEPQIDGRSNGLRDLLASFDVPMLEHHLGIGGRYSCLTNVGLIPAIARGLDPFAIRDGARTVIEGLLSCATPGDFAPAVGASVAVALHKDRNMPVSVMMPYSDRLGRFAAWYAQLWGESLGKGGLGSTPLSALGPVDQHSLLQLFMDGPRDHFISFVRTSLNGEGDVIDAELAARAGLDYLAGKTVGDLVAAQQQAVPEALVKVGRPVRTIDVPEMDEHAIGALVMHFMIETIIAGALLHVDPFDQPAVEGGKKMARAILDGQG